MTRWKAGLYLTILLILSAGLNIYLIDDMRRRGEVENGNMKCEENEILVSSVDRPSSEELFAPIHTGYSLEGEPIRFVDVRLKGTISGSMKKKYDFTPSTRLVRNIQYLVFFFSDYEINFREGDRISFYYRPKDDRVVYIRYKSRYHRSIFEAFLTVAGENEIYVTADGFFLTPCIKNGPFKGCPEVEFERHGAALLPLFLSERHVSVSLPFRARVREIGQNRSSGGTVEVFYPDYRMGAVFNYLGSLEPLKQGRIYPAGTVIGYSGYRKNGPSDGILYYLKRRDGKNVSPFLFHHIERRTLSDEMKLNLSISVNFYRNWYRQGKRFEEKHNQGG